MPVWVAKKFRVYCGEASTSDRRQRTEALEVLIYPATVANRPDPDAVGRLQMMDIASFVEDVTVSGRCAKRWKAIGETLVINIALSATQKRSLQALVNSAATSESCCKLDSGPLLLYHRYSRISMH